MEGENLPAAVNPGTAKKWPARQPRSLAQYYNPGHKYYHQTLPEAVWASTPGPKTVESGYKAEFSNNMTNRTDFCTLCLTMSWSYLDILPLCEVKQFDRSITHNLSELQGVRGTYINCWVRCKGWKVWTMNIHEFKQTDNTCRTGSAQAGVQ